MISAPLPDWIAAVMRGCRSFALMNSSCTSVPSALLASGAWRLSSTSASGMKSTQRTMCSLVPCAKAGARWAARMPATPVSLRKVRRSIEPPPVWSGWSTLVDLLQLSVGPLHGILGGHVGDDVLREDLGRLRGGWPGVAEQPRVARRRAEHLERLVELAPHGIVLPLLRRADRVAL